MSTVGERVGWILLDKVEELDARLKKVNKQAAKLGVAGIRYEQTGRQELRVVRECTSGLGRKVQEKAVYIEVAIIGEVPKLPGGWTLIGVVDHSEGMPIVKCVPGKELPAGQRERGEVCDHCGKKRERRDTFVLMGELGHVVQVGRNCLADFLGVSLYKPEALLALAQFLMDPLVALGGEEPLTDGWALYGRLEIDVLEVVLASGACIDEDGWVSRKFALESGKGGATADSVSFVLHPPKDITRTDMERLAKYKARMNEALRLEAEAALEWAKALMGNEKDYLNNLAVCATRGTVGADKFGIVVSLIATYRREMETLKQRKARVERSTHVGSVGVRSAMKLMLESKPRAFDGGGWGNRYLCKFRDEAGNLFTWWTNSDVCFDGGWEVGVLKDVKATVKKHEEFQGVKQTVLTRVTYKQRK